MPRTNDKDEVLRKALEYLSEIDSIPTMADIASATNVSEGYFKDNRNFFRPLYAKLLTRKREICAIAYRSLINESRAGNATASEKLIKVFGTQDERKAINGVFIEGEVELGLHEKAVANFNELFGKQ